MVLRREPATAAGADHAPLRVVSELFVEKGRTWCFCCGEDVITSYSIHYTKLYETTLIEGILDVAELDVDGSSYNFV